MLLCQVGVGVGVAGSGWMSASSLGCGWVGSVVLRGVGGYVCVFFVFFFLCLW